MSWYDFIPEKARFLIPPEVRAGTKAYEGDWKGALEAELGFGGTAVREGFGSMQDAYSRGMDKQRSGYDAAYADLFKLAEDSKGFQMQGLNKALGFYQPASDRLSALYGPPGSFRK